MMIPAFIKLSILINSFASWAISSSFGNLTPNATPLGISRAYVPPPIVLSGELSFVYFYYSYGIIRLYMIVGLINGFMIYYLIYRKFFRKMK